MAGFRNIKAYTDAEDLGQSHIVSFRKVLPSATMTTSAWFDYSYYSGSPPANFYASNPLEAAEVDAARGIYVPSVSPATQWLRNLKLQQAAPASTTVTSGRQQIILTDTLMYYPFVDTDAVGEQQDLINNITLPRYDWGSVIAVGQSAGGSAGNFTFSYTNQDGVSGRTSQTCNTFVSSGGGQVVATSVGSAASFHPFLPLAAGDKGVKSIESITFSVAGGGLLALVIVKPLLTAFSTQECRRTTTGNLESYGSCNEFASLIHNVPVQIKDGARLGLFSAGHAGSCALGVMTGLLETVWS